MLPDCSFQAVEKSIWSGRSSSGEPQHYDAVMSGSLTVYVHGRVVYQDVFRHPHWFTFCYHMMPEYDFSWALCSGGHQVDDDNE